MATSDEKHMGDVCWESLLSSKPALKTAREVTFTVDGLKNLVEAVAAKSYRQGRRDANSEGLFNRLFEGFGR